jgi:hypothetical protein
LEGDNKIEREIMSDEAKILKVVCQQLQLLANFDPPLTDNAGNPAPNISDRNVKDVYVRIDKEDEKADPPPPKPRLATFADNLKEKLGDFDLEPQQLVAGRYPTIGHLVRHIETA